jgi:hypothetical protein
MAIAKDVHELVAAIAAAGDNGQLHRLDRSRGIECHVRGEQACRDRTLAEVRLFR